MWGEVVLLGRLDLLFLVVRFMSEVVTTLISGAQPFDESQYRGGANFYHRQMTLFTSM